MNLDETRTNETLKPFESKSSSSDSGILLNSFWEINNIPDAVGNNEIVFVMYDICGESPKTITTQKIHEKAFNILLKPF